MDGLLPEENSRQFRIQGLSLLFVFILRYRKYTSSFVVFKKAVHCAVSLITREGFDPDGMQGSKNIVFDAGIVLLQAADQILDFLTLGTAVITAGIVLRKAAGTADEFQIVGSAPGDDGILLDAVKRPDQLHAGKVFTVSLGDDRFQLGGIEHGHDGGFDHIVEMMSQSDLVAAEFLCLVVQVSSAHAGTQIAGLSADIVGNLKDICFKDGNGNLQKLGVAFDFLTVGPAVAGIHDQIDQFERKITVLLQDLKQLGHAHGILPSRYAYGDSVIRLYQLIALDRRQKRRPQVFPVFPEYAAFRLLGGGKCSAHGFVLSHPVPIKEMSVALTAHS